MKKSDRAKKIQNILNDLFPNPAIPLIHNSNYTLLIAVLLSAQCTDERVNKITPALFEKAKTPFEMILLTEGQIEEIIRPCGLSKSKAKHIWKLSHMLIDQYQGEVPNTLELLEKLPGVGHKTASVVMVQAFNQPAFPVDTHIHRLAKRWKLSVAKNVVQTENDLKKLFPKSTWGIVHLQMIYFGRKFCPAKKHLVELCPICTWVTKEELL